MSQESDRIEKIIFLVLIVTAILYGFFAYSLKQERIQEFRVYQDK